MQQSTVLIYWERLKKYFANLDKKEITHGKIFWKKIKPNFNEKGSSSYKTKPPEKMV